jgi:hypothetical protein
MGALEDMIFAQLGGKGSSGQVDQIIAAENPYYMGATGVNSFMPLISQLSQPTLRSNGTFGPAALSGTSAAPWLAGGSFLSGLLKGLGNQYQADQQQQYFDAVRGGDTSKLSSSLFGQVQKDKQLFGALRDIKNQDVEDARKNAFIEALAKTEDPGQQARIIKTGKQLGYFGDEIEVPEMRPVGVPTSSALSELGPDLGVQSVDVVEANRFQELAAAGWPRTQAATAAKAYAEDMRERAGKLFTPKLKESSDAIGTAEDIIRKGEEGVAKAGNTGSKLGSAYEKTVAFLSPILPGEQAEARQQAVGDTLLSQTQNLGAMLNRIKGSGALSDMESRALFETAMSPTKTKDQNEAILQQYKNGLAIMKEHQDFLSYAASKTMATPEIAQSLWEKYKLENPIVSKNNKGDYTVDQNRTPWQKFDFKDAYRRFLTGEVAQGVSGADAIEEPPLGYEFTGTIDAQGRKGLRRIQ